MTQSKLHMQAPASKLPAADQPLVNQSMNTPPCSGLPSPMSVSSHPIDQSGVPGANNDDIKASKTTGMSTASVNNTESPRVMSSIGSVAASAIMSSGISFEFGSEILSFYAGTLLYQLHWTWTLLLHTNCSRIHFTSHICVWGCLYSYSSWCSYHPLKNSILPFLINLFGHVIGSSMMVSSSYVPHLLLCQYGWLRNVKLYLLLLDYGIRFSDERLIFYKMLLHICSLL